MSKISHKKRLAFILVWAGSFMLGAGVAAIQPPAIDGFMQRPLSSLGKSLGISYFLDVPSRGNSGEVGVRERPGASPQLLVFDATVGQWVSAVGPDAVFDADGINVPTGTGVTAGYSFIERPDTGIQGTIGGELHFISLGVSVLSVLNQGNSRFLVLTGTTFANLTPEDDGSIAFCSDCTFANPCASGGTGAIAKRLNGAWRCD